MSFQDWFLDRFRTVVNVFGNAVGAAVVAHVCRAKLAEPSDQQIDEPVVFRFGVEPLHIARYAGGLSDVDNGKHAIWQHFSASHSVHNMPSVRMIDDETVFVEI